MIAALHPRVNKNRKSIFRRAQVSLGPCRTLAATGTRFVFASRNDL